MDKFWTIFKSEYAQVVKKRSFLIGIFLTPLFMIGITILPAMLADRERPMPTDYAIIDADGRGIGDRLEVELAAYKLSKDTTIQAYRLDRKVPIARGDTLQLARVRSQLDSLILEGAVKLYIVIFPDAESSDSILLVSKSLNFKTSSRVERKISNILASLRLEKSFINLPVDSVLTMTRRIELMEGSPGGKKRDFMTIYMGGVVFVFIIFGSVIGFGSILMRTVIEEKNSRVMEILMSSVSPFQLMSGKIFGLGAANLTQVGIWIALGAVLFSHRSAFSIPPGVEDIIFNPVIIFFFVSFLIIAYVMYATMFALIGSVCSTDKETQNFMFPIIMSLMLPIFLAMYVVQEPDSLTSIALSLIPIFTPTMMIMRLNVVAPESFNLADPMILQAFLGLAISVFFTMGVVWATSRIFRMGILMYGKRATLPEILKWVRHK